MAFNPFAVTGQYVNSSSFSVLSDAVAAAVSGGFGLNIDRNWIVPSDLIISVSSVRFSGGILKPANTVTITLNSPVVASVSQIFDLSLGGSIRGTMVCPEVYPEWWGSASTNIQSAVDYVLASNIKTQKIRLINPLYTITAPVVISGNQHPNIEGSGQYSTYVNFSTTSEQAAFSVIGTEQFSGGSLRGLTVTDPTNTVTTSGLLCLEVSGSIGFEFCFASGTAKRTVLEYNSSTSVFSEFNRGIIQSPTTTATALEYRTNGSSINNSFHGACLLKGTVINTLAGNPCVLIGANAVPYESTLDLQIFTFDNGATHDAVLIQNNSSTETIWFDGTISLERFNSGLVTIGSGTQFYSQGSVGYFGDQSQLRYGSLVLADRVHYSKSGAVINTLRPVNLLNTTTSNTTSFNYPISYNQYTALIDVSGANYHYILYGLLTTDDTSGYSWNLLSTPLSQNGAGYGAPTISAGTAAVTVSGSWGSASITTAVTFTQIGQGFAHHDIG